MVMMAAKADRTLRHFAEECGISYVQLRKLELLRQESAPGIPLLRKLAAHSGNGISFEDLLYAAGYVDDAVLESKMSDLEKDIKQLKGIQLSRLHCFVQYLMYEKAKTEEETQEQ